MHERWPQLLQVNEKVFIGGECAHYKSISSQRTQVQEGQK